MKKVYCLVDKHFGNVIAGAKTRKILEEILMDMFMENFQAEMQEAADAHWINVENPTKECRQYARDTWNMVLKWYNSVYDIQKVDLI